MLKIKPCKVIKTKDFQGSTNGWLMEIASSLDGWSKFLDNAQVYLTTVMPGKKKGFHLHHKKTNQITCVRGKVVLAIWDGKKIREITLNSKKPKTVRVPKKHALCFYNPGPKIAYILNLCSPPYDPKINEQEDLDLDWSPKL